MRVVMIGGTGAVGSEVAATLSKMPEVAKLTLLGRRKLETPGVESARQELVDVLESSSYENFLEGHDVGISSLGVGQPSGMPREQFTAIDKTAVVDFARACKQHGVQHFQSLGSVGTSARSRNFYLRSKGQLEEELGELGFRRLSLFHPSMILTPENRYGVMQGITLRVWPLLSRIFFGPLEKLRGIRSQTLGTAIARNVLASDSGTEVLEWRDFQRLARG